MGSTKTPKATAATMIMTRLVVVSHGTAATNWGGALPSLVGNNSGLSKVMLE